MGQTGSIHLEKTTNGVDGDAPYNGIVTSGLLTTYGADILWEYSITNTGDVLLANVTCIDDKEGFICTVPELAVGETVVCEKEGIADQYGYFNVGFASGIPVDEEGNLVMSKAVADEDSSRYSIQPEEGAIDDDEDVVIIVLPSPANPSNDVDPSDENSASISVEKMTNGFDADLANTGPSLELNDPVVWEYVITNTGNMPLANVTCIDDKEGFICALPELAVGETAVCEKEGFADQLAYFNLAFVSGIPIDEEGNLIQGKPVADEDSSHYHLLIEEIIDGVDEDDDVLVDQDAPAVNLEKTTAIAGQNPVSSLVLYETDIQQLIWYYELTNVGNASLINLNVSDDQEGFVCTIPILDPGQSAICELEGQSAPGNYENIGFVSGTAVDVDGNPVSDKPVTAMAISSYSYELVIEDGSDGYDGNPIIVLPDNDDSDDSDGSDGLTDPTPDPIDVDTGDTEDDNDDPDGPEGQTGATDVTELADTEEDPETEETEVACDPQDCESIVRCVEPGETIVICPANCGAGDLEILDIISLYHCGVETEDGCLEYTPLPGMEIVGGETLTIIYTDGDNCFSQEVELTIGGCDQPIDCEDNIMDLMCILPTTPTVICPNFCEFPNGGFTITDVNSTYDCSILILDDGCFRYTSLPGFSGGEELLVTACLNGDCATVQIVLEVGDCEDGPTEPEPCEVDDQNLCVGPVELIQICIDWCDDDAEILTVNTVFDCSYQIVSDNCFEYRGLPGFQGEEEITVSGCDQNGNCESATIYLEVSDDCSDEPDNNENVDAHSDNFSTDCSSIAIPVLANDEGANLSICEIENIDFGTLVIDGSNVIFTPFEDASGNENFNYTACDESGNSDESIVYISIDCEDETVTAIDDNYTVDDDHTLLVDLESNDDYPCSNPDIELLSEPSSGLVLLVNDLLTYVPVPGFEGQVDFDYEICCDDYCDQATVTINVLEDGPCDLNELKIPEVFTPNLDGVNDQISMLNLESCNSEFRMRIYNQIGLEIWSHQSERLDELNWDGNQTSDKKELSEGTYFYVIEQLMGGELISQKNGFIELKR